MLSVHTVHVHVVIMNINIFKCLIGRTTLILVPIEVLLAYADYKHWLCVCVLLFHNT